MVGMARMEAVASGPGPRLRSTTAPPLSRKQEKTNQFFAKVRESKASKRRGGPVR